MKLLTKTVMALTGVAAIGTAVVMYAKKRNHPKTIENDHFDETMDQTNRNESMHPNGDTIIHMDHGDGSF